MRMRRMGSAGRQQPTDPPGFPRSSENMGVHFVISLVIERDHALVIGQISQLRPVLVQVGKWSVIRSEFFNRRLNRPQLDSVS